MRVHEFITLLRELPRDHELEFIKLTQHGDVTLELDGLEVKSDVKITENPDFISALIVRTPERCRIILN